MADRSALLTSIANTIKPYRAVEIPEPTPEHVDRWIKQFTPEQQLPLLHEFDQVIRKSFITKKNVEDFLGNLVTNPKLTGGNPTEFWRKLNFLRVQQDGVSQREMLKLMAGQLSEKLGLALGQCGDATGDYIYLDDIMCTGNRVASDLEKWIANEAPKKAKLHVVLAVLHSGGVYYLRTKRIKAAIEKSGKEIELHFWRAWELENTKYYKNVSDVLWPVGLPDDQELHDYAQAMKFPFIARAAGGVSKMFSSEQGRQVLENEMLIAGMKIRSQHATPKEILKPLGYSSFGLGFGSTLATYRNCPNTAPLAVWWGEGAAHGALQWYPLLPRKTYSSAENVFKSTFY